VSSEIIILLISNYFVVVILLLNYALISYSVYWWLQRDITANSFVVALASITTCFVVTQLQVNGSYSDSLEIGSSKRAKKCCLSRHTVAVTIPPEKDQRAFPVSVSNHT